MKILFCPTHYVFDGLERGSEITWAYNISSRLSNLYTESDIVTGFSNEKGDKYKIHALQENKKQIDMGVWNSFVFSLSYGLFGIYLLLRKKHDIHHHILPFAIGKTFNIAALVMRQNVFVVGPIQSTLPYFADNLHDINTKTNKVSELSNFIQRLIFKLAYPITNILSLLTLKRADGLIAVDEEVKKILMNKGINESKIKIIPPGIEILRFHKSERQCSNEVRTILSVGALIERKGFDTLLKSLPAILFKYPNIKVEILGDGPRKSELIELARQLKIEDRVIFHGHIAHSQVKKYYDRADIFVTASRFECRAQMYLEAMAAGLPIVSTDNSGARSNLKGGGGIIVQISDHLGMENAICRLIENPLLRVAMSKKSQETIKKYDWDSQIIPHYVDLYNALLQKP